MQKNALRTATGVLATAALLVGAPPAIADSDDHANEVVDFVNDVVPSAVKRSAPAGVSDSPTDVDAGENFAVQLGTRPAISIDGPGDRQDLTVFVPTEAGVTDSSTADTGAAVFGGQADVVVEDWGNEGVQIQTVTRSDSGPHSFRYGFGSAELRMAEDGRIRIGQQSDGVFVASAMIDEAWAVDAQGDPVDTSYRLVDGQLVQDIHPDASTEYPVVADPTITAGWGIYVTYTNAEVKELSSFVGISQMIGAGLCLALPQPYGGVCGIIQGNAGSSVYNTFKNAAASGNCVEMRYIPLPLPPYAQLVGWKSVSC